MALYVLILVGWRLSRGVGLGKSLDKWWVRQKGVWSTKEVYSALLGSNAERQTSVSCLLYRSMHWDPALHFVVYLNSTLHRLSIDLRACPWSTAFLHARYLHPLLFIVRAADQALFCLQGLDMSRRAADDRDTTQPPNVGPTDLTATTTSPLGSTSLVQQICPMHLETGASPRPASPVVRSCM
jgi:hypothetical protein